jgi:hypothetical protein
MDSHVNAAPPTGPRTPAFIFVHIDSYISIAEFQSQQKANADWLLMNFPSKHPTSRCSNVNSLTRRFDWINCRQFYVPILTKLNRAARLRCQLMRKNRFTLHGLQRVCLITDRQTRYRRRCESAPPSPARPPCVQSILRSFCARTVWSILQST